MHPIAIAEISVAVLIPLVSGVVVSALNADQLKTWYAKSLKKSWFHPPLRVFAPLWTVLYVMMGVASWMVYQQGGLVRQTIPLTFYATTLVLQWTWSLVLLRLKRLDWAMVTAVVLTGFEVSTLMEFAKVLGLPVASSLMGPVCLVCLAMLVISYDLMACNPRRGASGSPQREWEEHPPGAPGLSPQQHLPASGVLEA